MVVHCPQCKLKLVTADEFRCHYSAVHLRYFPFACLYCDDWYASREKLRYHYTLQHPNEFVAINCNPDCNKEGQLNMLLTVHFAQKTEDTDRISVTEQENRVVSRERAFVESIRYDSSRDSLRTMDDEDMILSQNINDIANSPSVNITANTSPFLTSPPPMDEREQQKMCISDQSVAIRTASARKKRTMSTEYAVERDWTAPDKHNYPGILVQILSGGIVRFRCDSALMIDPKLTAECILGSDVNSKAAVRRAANVESKGLISSDEKRKRAYHAKWLAFVDTFLHLLAGVDFKHGRMYQFENGCVKGAAGKLRILAAAIERQPQPLQTALQHASEHVGSPPMDTTRIEAIAYVVKQLKHRERQFRFSAKSQNKSQ